MSTYANFMATLQPAPDQQLAAIARRDQQRYEQDYLPVEDRAIATLSDTSVIREAEANLERGFNFQTAAGRFKRDLGRYGAQADGALRREATAGFHGARALNSTQVLADARLDQFDRNRGFRNELINVGRGVQESGNSMLTEAAGLKTTRDANNATAKAQAHAAKVGTGAQLISTALFAAMVM